MPCTTYGVTLISRTPTTMRSRTGYSHHRSLESGLTAVGQFWSF
jgi:hypothetical protein